MITQTPIVELFGKVVQATEARILPYLKTVRAGIQQLHYEYGHPLEIINTLKAMNMVQANQYKKYPLVALFQDFTESEAGRPGQLETVRVRVVIANQWAKDAKAKDRYEGNFKPILYPIYEELIRQIARTPYFRNVGIPAKNKIDRPYWGREGLYGNEGNVFDDVLDCVEIRDLQLIIPRTRCVPAHFKNF